jgi:hypothetical protein
MCLALLIILCNSCNIFETREPQPPTQSSSNFSPAYNAADVFDNLRNAIRDLNTFNYLQSFADSMTGGRVFQFEPTPKARSQFIGVFASWTKQSEQQYFETMKSRIPTGSSASLEFTTALNPISVQSDSAQYEIVYLLTVQHTQSNVSKIFQGRSQMFLIKDRTKGTWSLSRWVDIGDTQNDPSWSDLKGAFAQ